MFVPDGLATLETSLVVLQQRPQPLLNIRFGLDPHPNAVTFKAFQLAILIPITDEEGRKIHSAIWRQSWVIPVDATMLSTPPGQLPAALSSYGWQVVVDGCRAKVRNVFEKIPWVTDEKRHLVNKMSVVGTPITWDWITRRSINAYDE